MFTDSDNIFIHAVTMSLVSALLLQLLKGITKTSSVLLLWVLAIFHVGSAIGFRLDSLLKLTDTRARNNKMTLMHYLCKVDFSCSVQYISYFACQIIS